jgi:flagellar biosynthetic protein FliO
MNSLELFPSLLKIGSALAVTVGAMIAIAYLFKKLMNKGGLKMNDSELIKILSVKYLGPKNRIMLINVSKTIMVIGVSGNNISLLTKIVDPGSLEHLKDIQEQEGKSVPFSDYLNDLFKGTRA